MDAITLTGLITTLATYATPLITYVGTEIGKSMLSESGKDAYNGLKNTINGYEPKAVEVLQRIEEKPNKMEFQKEFTALLTEALKDEGLQAALKGIIDEAAQNKQINDIPFIIYLIQSNRINEALKKADRIDFSGSDKFVYNRKREAFYMGLEGQKLLDWTREMTVFLSTFD